MTTLGEIGFPEFTAKVTDVFDALVAANMRQTEAYIELVKQVSKTLKDFVDSTKDDISGEMILQFLSTVLNADPSEKVKVDGSLSVDEAKALNEATMISTEEGLQGAKLNETVTGGLKLDKDMHKSILDAVAKRIAANKYTMLKEMVKMGVLRLVVEHGVIETRLVFDTSSFTYRTSNSSNYHRDDFKFRASAKTGGFLSPWIKASASTSYSSINISTSNRTDKDISGSHVQIYGYVRIDFKTDYQPMSTP